MGDDNSFDFGKIPGQLSMETIAFKEIAKFVVPIFAAFRDEGLTAREAAILTIAFITGQSTEDSDGSDQED